MRAIVAILAAVFAWFGSIAAASAQNYPSKPITIVVPYPAGGSTGVLARILAEPLQKALGQTIVIENVGGAGGSIGVGRVARAAPDGYTLGLSHIQTHVINGATMKLPYDVVKDFQPVALIADTPQMITTRSNFPANNLKEMIAWLKANPNKGTSGAVGVGGPGDITAYQFQKQTGTTFQIVPYRGGGPLLQDLVAGHVDLNFGQAATYLGAVRNHQLKAMAMLSKDRWWAAPEIPSMDEAGVPGLLSVVLARAVVAQGYAEEHRGQAQRCGGDRAGRSHGAPALQGCRPGHLAARAADARSVGSASES